MPRRAEVRVGPKRLLAVSAARLIETNRIGPLPDAPLTAKVRSLAKPVPVTLEGPLGDGAATTIRFARPEFGVAPGQAAVLYAGERVVGGGWIEIDDALFRPGLEHAAIALAIARGLAGDERDVGGDALSSASSLRKTISIPGSKSFLQSAMPRPAMKRHEQAVCAP